MARTYRHHFGVDLISFEDNTGNILGSLDVSNASIELSWEIAERKGGTNNDTRAAALHSRSARLTAELGNIDVELLKLMTGGGITSYGVSASSIVDYTAASGIDSYIGNSDVMSSLITSVVVITPGDVTTDDYLVKAINNDDVTITRARDGVIVTSLTLTASNSFTVTGEGISILTGATGAESLNPNNVMIFRARTELTSYYRKLTLSASKPTDLKVRIRGEFEGQKMIITANNIKPAGTPIQMSATEFAIPNFEAPLILENTSGELGNLFDIVQAL